MSLLCTAGVGVPIVRDEVSVTLQMLTLTAWKKSSEVRLRWCR